jgi:hypothetical protein
MGLWLKPWLFVGLLSAHAVCDGTDSLLAALRQTRLNAAAALRSGRDADVWGLRDSLVEAHPGTKLLVFLPGEEELLAMMTRRWDILLDSARWNRRFSVFLEGGLAPDADGFGDSLGALFKIRGSAFERDLDQASLEPFRKEFLRLVFLDRWQWTNRRARNFDYARFDRLVRDWLRRFPDKPYAPKVRDEFLNETEPEIWGGGADFGIGWNGPWGSLDRSLERNGGLVMGGEVTLSRFSLRGQMMLGFGARLKRDGIYQGRVWRAGREYGTAEMELQAGAELYRSESWRVVPYLSLGTLSLQNDPLLDSLSDTKADEATAQAGSPGFGIHLQKFFRGWGDSPGYVGIAAGMRYPRLGRAIPGLSGSETYLEMHLGFFSRKWVKKP